MKKLPYREGDIFALPLRNGGYSLGVIARSPKRGIILLGYFFPNVYPMVPKPDQIPKLRPQNAIEILIFGDLSLINGEWKIITNIDNFKRDEWPMPKFLRREELTGRSLLITYADDNPGKKVAQEICSPETTGYPADILCGAGYVEIVLTKRLGPKQSG
jgi:hypothetical protein